MKHVVAAQKERYLDNVKSARTKAKTEKWGDRKMKLAMQTKL